MIRRKTQQSFITVNAGTVTALLKTSFLKHSITVSQTIGKLFIIKLFNFFQNIKEQELRKEP